MQTVRPTLALPFALALAALVGACDDPGAALEITDARTFRADDARIVVDVDVRAHEALGGNVGVYCVRTSFAGQANAPEHCHADLEDGDRRTLRFVSDGWLAAGAAITVRVRLDRVDVARSLVVPE